MINKDKKVAEFQICGHTIGVFEDPHLLSDSENYGEWQYRELALSVDGLSCPAVQQETLCHEIVEIWNEVNELKLPHSKIQSLGNCLFQFLMDNDPYVFQKPRHPLKSSLPCFPDLFTQTSPK